MNILLQFLLATEWRQQQKRNVSNEKLLAVQRRKQKPQENDMLPNKNNQRTDIDIFAKASLEHHKDKLEEMEKEKIILRPSFKSQHSKAWLHIRVRTSRYLTNVAMYDYAH